MSDVWIVIPVHNRRVYTESCLRHLSSQDTDDFVVVVVDAGSTDGTSEVLEQFPGVHVVMGSHEWWWSESVNAGVRYAIERGAAWIITLNDDTEPGPHFVSGLTAYARRDPRGLYGALETDIESGEVVYAGETVDWKSARYLPLASDVPEPVRRGAHAVTHFPGRGLIVPTEVYSAIGMYDQDAFPQAIADYDFTHRALRAGYPIYCVWDVELAVHSAASGGVALKNTHTWTNFTEHLFGMKGAGNLPRFITYGLRNAPRRYVVPFLISGIARRVLGYLRDWLIAIVDRRRGRGLES